MKGSQYFEVVPEMLVYVNLLRGRKLVRSDSTSIVAEHWRLWLWRLEGITSPIVLLLRVKLLLTASATPTRINNICRRQPLQEVVLVVVAVVAAAAVAVAGSGRSSSSHRRGCCCRCRYHR